MRKVKYDKIYCIKRQKHKLHKDGTNKEVTVGRGKLMKASKPTQNLQPLRNIESGRKSLCQERVHQLVILYQMVSSENIFTQVTLYRLERV